MLFLLHFLDDVVERDAFIYLERIEEVCGQPGECLVIRVDHEAFRRRCGKLCSIWAEANIFDSHGKLDLTLEQVLCSFGPWHALILSFLVSG